MLHYAAVFLVIAMIAALFGFTGIAAGGAGIAQLLFSVFMALAVGAVVLTVVRRRPQRVVPTTQSEEKN